MLFEQFKSEFESLDLETLTPDELDELDNKVMGFRPSIPATTLKDGKNVRTCESRSGRIHRSKTLTSITEWMMSGWQRIYVK